MKAIGKYVRECCGKRLMGKHQFCPVCGAKADRPAVNAATPFLVEIDKRARINETNAQKMRARIRQSRLGDFAERELARKRIQGFENSARWYRSVEALITNLLERETSN